jgi:translation initiation factor IF-1
MPEPARDPILVDGMVREQLERALYRVALENEGRGEVTAHVAGGSSLLRLVPGDAVVVELMPYDRGRGRIVRRRG